MAVTPVVNPSGVRQLRSPARTKAILEAYGVTTEPVSEYGGIAQLRGLIVALHNAAVASGAVPQEPTVLTITVPASEDAGEIEDAINSALEDVGSDATVTVAS